MCLLLILSNKLDLNQETRFTILGRIAISKNVTEHNNTKQNVTRQNDTHQNITHLYLEWALLTMACTENVSQS